MKIGLVYYSRTGNTRQVAKTLEEKFKEKNAEVDLIEIEHVKRPGYFTGGKASTFQQELPIKNNHFDMQKYDIIIVGSPTWSKRPSPFVKSFINKAENIKGKKVAVFSTGMSRINEREQFKEIIKNDLKNAGMKTFDSYLALQFKKEQIIDGEQNIDDFVNTVLKL
ncbi:MAG: flavodoxin family protein [Candidatus Thermoplasmatota archaeon]|nr:flavodoxin family protein [Candidatus Thermoplasmatota archaeon]